MIKIDTKIQQREQYQSVISGSRGLSILCLIILFCFHFNPLFAQVRVVKSAGGFTGNPTLHFQGVEGSAQASAAVNFMLRACGWFDFESAAKADYAVSGSCDKNHLILTVRQGRVVACSLKVPIISGDLRRAAQRGVDAILQRIFKIDGICFSRIAFCAEVGNGIHDIYVCDIDGQNIQRVTKFRSLAVEPEWFPDNKSLLYTKYNKSSTSIVQTSLSPLKSRRLTFYPGLNTGAAISPDGKYLALILSRDNQVDLYVKELTGKAYRRLTNNRTVEASPCWSPRGDAICFVSGRTGRPGLYLVSPNGGAVRRLQTIGSEAVTPSWSGDDKIAYSAKMGANYTIAVLDISGKTPGGVVVKAAGDWESPSWAPDGRHLVCSRSYGGKKQLYIVDTWTGRSRQLTQIKNNLSTPCWSGLGR